MKLHKKFDHNLPGIHYWGERPGVDIRVNWGHLPAGADFPKDQPHYHKTRTTYFCVLEGSMVVNVEGEDVVVNSDAMLEVGPNQVYATISVGPEGCRWVVIGSHNEVDKVNI